MKKILISNGASPENPNASPAAVAGAIVVGGGAGAAAAAETGSQHGEDSTVSSRTISYVHCLFYGCEKP